MDKYELVFDLIEHSENYTAEQLAEILSDPEARDIYNLLCKTDSAIVAGKEADVEAEWERFSAEHSSPSRRSFLWTGSRAASIAAIIGSSIVAVAAGIAVTVAVIDHRQEPIAANVAVAPAVASAPADVIAAEDDTVKADMTPIMFENEPLENIMKAVADAYGVEVRFNDKAVASLRLYYKLDQSLPLNEIVEQLNTFERINIRQDGGILNID